jgi:hypothetical protein
MAKQTSVTETKERRQGTGTGKATLTSLAAHNPQVASTKEKV